jgi:hypothetical protein
LLVLYALNKKGYVLIPEQIIKYTNNMKTPKYSVGDVFCRSKFCACGCPKILFIHSEFYDHTGKSDEVYYCLTSRYKGYPPVHSPESSIDMYYVRV